MILTDVNILVHAFRADSPEHLTCRAWLDGVVNGDARYGMAPQVLSGVIRITTHPKVFATPSGLDEVLQFCDILLDQSHSVIMDHARSRLREVFGASVASAGVMLL